MSIDPIWLQAQFPMLSGIAALADGGQKWVFEAIDPDHGEIVLKLFAPAQDAERVRREILAVDVVGSARVPSIYEAGTLATNVGSVVWLKEKRIRGETLRARLTRGPLDPTLLRGLAQQVLEALADAEAAHVVHRDVKPENIILDSSGDFWLLDFGIARHLDLASVTANANPLGPATIGYAPPEQLRNRKREIDARADLFALGVLLYEAATGTNPLASGARDQREIIARTETTAIPALNLSWDSLGSFSNFVLALTQRRPEHRPRTVADALAWCRQLT